MPTEATKNSDPLMLASCKSRVLVAMLLLSVVLGALAPFFNGDPRILAGIVAFSFAFLTVIWCVYDARERDFGLGVALKLLVFFVLVVGFPVYLFRSRGFKAFLPLAASIAIAVLLTMLASFAEHLTLSMGERLGWWGYWSY